METFEIEIVIYEDFISSYWLCYCRDHYKICPVAVYTVWPQINQNINSSINRTQLKNLFFFNLKFGQQQS